MKLHDTLPMILIGMIFSGFSSELTAQDSSLQKALSIKPRQANVNCDHPDDSQIEGCKLTKSDDVPGFVVYDNTGRILRKFLDTDRDGDLDQWSYYQNGIEVYRDIDSNSDKKTDAYRWVGRGGTRWGLDPNQDGRIDSWSVISAEEVAAEVFEAIKTRDQRRFDRLLLTSSELQTLELGDEIGPEVEKRLKSAREGFTKFCEAQREISATSEWVHAGTGSPSMLAKAAYGNGKDVVLYDHVSAVFTNSGDQFGQLSIGSIVRVGPVWRLIELPEIVDESRPISNGGAFFPLPGMNVELVANTGSSDPADRQLAKLYEQLENIEKDLSAADRDVDIARLEGEKAELLEEFFVTAKDPQIKQDWLENLADTVASAYQSGRFPGGLKFLDGLAQRLEKQNVSTGVDYVQWRAIFADYGLKTEGDRRARDEAHEELMANLEEFQRKFRDSPLAADALCQLGIHHEIANDTDKAVAHYREAARRFPDTSFGKRASGALLRLDPGDDVIPFTGQTLSGNKFDLRDRRLRDKVVVIHFWETWCADGLSDIRKLVEKYKDDVVFVGCNIESETEAFEAFMRENRDLALWTQLHAPGSMESSPLAQQLGVPSEPLILVFDKDGKLVVSDVNVNDLEREIERQRRK